MKDERFRERFEDVEAVADRLLRRLLGLPEDPRSTRRSPAPSSSASSCRRSTRCSCTGSASPASPPSAADRRRTPPSSRARSACPTSSACTGSSRRCRPATRVCVDGTYGEVIVSPDAATLRSFDERRTAEAERRRVVGRDAAAPAVTLDGTVISLGANIEVGQRRCRRRSPPAPITSASCAPSCSISTARRCRPRRSSIGDARRHRARRRRATGHLPHARHRRRQAAARRARPRRAQSGARHARHPLLARSARHLPHAAARALSRRRRRPVAHHVSAGLARDRGARGAPHLRARVRGAGRRARRARRRGAARRHDRDAERGAHRRSHRRRVRLHQRRHQRSHPVRVRRRSAERGDGLSVPAAASVDLARARAGLRRGGAAGAAGLGVRRHGRRSVEHLAPARPRAALVLDDDAASCPSSSRWCSRPSCRWRRSSRARRSRSPAPRRSRRWRALASARGSRSSSTGARVTARTDSLYIRSWRVH